MSAKCRCGFARRQRTARRWPNHCVLRENRGEDKRTDDWPQIGKNNTCANGFVCTIIPARYFSCGIIVYNGILFVPYVLASVVTTAIWRNLLSPQQGIGAALADLGIEGFDIAWLGRTETSWMSIAFIDNWHFWGLLMILFLAAMHAIPPVLYDAAKIDGAN